MVIIPQMLLEIKVKIGFAAIYAATLTHPVLTEKSIDKFAVNLYNKQYLCRLFTNDN